ncbi:MAG: formylglycine-generating enzyme family protein [Gammaproteobacteria bacterium]|nr:formylglycine-generating enzyme family protein [Gammaproteobacteria bacterium]
MDDSPRLSILLDHLRLNGFRIGSYELQRLQAIFTNNPSLNHAQLCQLLQTVLAKNTAQRRSIEHVFNSLIPFSQDDQPQHSQHGAVIQADPQPKPTQQEQSEPTPQSKKPFNLWKTGLLMFLTVLSGLLFSSAYQYWHAQQEIKSQVEPPSDIDDTKKVNEITKNIPKQQKELAQLQLAETVTLWTPTITTKPIDPLPTIWPPLLLFVSSGIGFFWLLREALSRSQVNIPQPPRIQVKGRSFLPDLPESAQYQLLSPEQRREITWGVGRFLSDQPRQQLDIPRSVRETARQALPSLYFECASQQRTVWIWQDRSSASTNLMLLAQELTQTLRAVNCPVINGYFHGLPDQVSTAKGESLWSMQHPQPDHQPLVLVLCDYTSMHTALLSNLHRQQQCFALLVQWRQLCLVDCSQPAGQLNTLIPDNQLTCLIPDQLPGWMTRHSLKSEISDSATPLQDLQRWAIACSLPDRPLLDAEIRTLHNRLDLNCQWHYQGLERYARHTGHGFDFKQQRQGLLHDFATQANPDHPYHSDFHITLDFWLQRFHNIDNQLSNQQTPQQPWTNSRRHHELHTDIAILHLWERPDDAAAQLADLHAHHKLRDSIRYKLSVYACQDWPNPEHYGNKWVRLPWNWQRQSLQTRQQLLKCGLGGIKTQVSLQWDGLTTGLLAIFVAIMVTTFVISIKSLLSHPPLAERINTALDSPRPPQHLVAQTLENNQLYLGTVNSPDGLTRVSVPEDHQAIVHWKRKPGFPARSKFPHIVPEPNPDNRPQLWLSGENSRPQRPNDDWPDLSITIIEGKATDPKIQKLAAKLLDSGSADQVLIGKHWGQAQKILNQRWQNLKSVQWLYMTQQVDQSIPVKGQHIAHFTLSTKELNKRFNTTGTHDANAWQSDSVIIGNPRLIGLFNNQPIIELAHNLKLVRISSGQFEMGSNQGEKDEQPVHTVKIPYDFYLSQTEITFAQYDAYVKASLRNSSNPPQKPDDEGWGRGNRPVINVSWNDAQGYVNWLTQTNPHGLQCRLPSEAEWEYAARAGTTTNYFWGNDSGTNHANCDGCGSQWDNKQTAPVGQFPANLFGLHDMHGNTWEWTQDCWHHDYKEAPTDGTAWETGCDSDRRVVRGGSWYSTPYNVRSAYRIVDDPGYRYNNVGFRVLCAPPSEH